MISNICEESKELKELGVCCPTCTQTMLPKQLETWTCFFTVLILQLQPFLVLRTNLSSDGLSFGDSLEVSYYDDKKMASTPCL
jgi:hypothetical protein